METIKISYYNNLGKQLEYNQNDQRDSSIRELSAGRLSRDERNYNLSSTIQKKEPLDSGLHAYDSNRRSGRSGQESSFRENSERDPNSSRWSENYKKPRSEVKERNSPMSNTLQSVYQERKEWEKKRENNRKMVEETRTSRKQRNNQQLNRKEREAESRKTILDSLRDRASMKQVLDFDKRMEMTNLHSELANQDVDIAFKQAQTKLLEPDIIDLEKDVSMLEQEVKDVKERNNKIEYDISIVESSIEAKKKEKELLQLKLDNRQETLKSIKTKEISSMISGKVLNKDIKALEKMLQIKDKEADRHRKKYEDLHEDYKKFVSENRVKQRRMKPFFADNPVSKESKYLNSPSRSGRIRDAPSNRSYQKPSKQFSSPGRQFLDTFNDNIDVILSNKTPKRSRRI